ncbi:N-acetylmuramoyl-L-alanine amidase family protein [Anaeromyxobacter oryzisoli]|uniref:N-acetylmuramoyl-L-alanine amidase family protein n=1 Tax=Anaeromyxobacter oryzisoli TaxID=2925408 RepID=UPI001F59582C|nr:N-acetylmuramoyl-L-alanine amidase [Anaeromyxobacter sp. SG63]
MLAPVAALLLSVAAATPPVFTVVVDPGHGGAQEGAISPRGLRESDLTLEIARRLGARLRRMGARVILTRTGDVTVPMANRAAIANASRADLFVSIHLNSMPTVESRRVTAGVETYFLSADATDTHASAVAARENADRLAGEPEPDPDDTVGAILASLEDAASLDASSRLAYRVHERLVAALGAGDRGVKQAPFYVLAGARMPSVLVEVGFISNEAEAERLRSKAYQEKAAAALADAIATFRQETRAARN